MIEKIELKTIPFVDGVPAKGQESISWLVNKKDCLSGAAKQGDNDGNLNRTGVQIQKNIKSVKSDVDDISVKLNETIGVVNTMSEALNISEETDLVKTINETKERVDIHEIHIQNAEDDIGVLERRTADIELKLGQKSDLDVNDKTVFDDLYWIKREMGSYPGQDINGQQTPGTLGTGMKRRIIDVSTETRDNTVRLTRLEDKWQESNIGTLDLTVEKIRSEIGPETEQTDETIYERLSGLEEQDKTHDLAIEDINNRIGQNNIANEITDTNNRVNVLETEVLKPNGLKSRVSTIESKIGDNNTPGTMMSDISNLKIDLKNTNDIVGHNTSSGLRGSVAWIEAQVGLVDDPAEGSIVSKIEVLTDTTNELAGSIQGLQAEIGTSKTGLKGSVAKNTKTLNGTNINGTTVDEIGVTEATKRSYAYTQAAIELPPEDGLTYICRQKKWVPIGTSVGVFTTPTWEGELKDEVNIPVDQALFNERCELIDGGININEGGVYEITLSVNFLNNYKTRDVTLIAKVNDETVIETSANIELMEAKTVYGSIIKRFAHNSVLKLFIKDNEHNESLIQLSNVDIKIKPII